MSVNIKLEKPFAGWSSIHLSDEDGNEFVGTLSYVDPVPDIFLFAFEKNSKYAPNFPIALSFDEEGTEFTLVVSSVDMYCISDRSELSVKRLWISYDEFVFGVCNSLLENLNEWAGFDIFTDNLKEYEEVRKQNARNYKERIEKILEGISNI